ncbi:MAG TPA: WecB/TagA/CpsF family glycosyltransferase, partial [Povalibacter sp.]|nr:WecB/TagA/CpsF family glycosyltransferase [Povalibacter sp.]
ASVTGSIDDLIELGKRRDIDWIFLTLPAAEEERMLSIVRRLKALAVTVALCPPNIGLRAPYHRIDYVGDDIPVTLLVDRPLQRWRVAVKSAGQFLPRWITTLLLMPVLLAALTRRNSHAGLWEQGGQAEPLRCEIDGYDLPAFVDVARRFGMQRYGYVITPNVDQLIRLHDDSNFREICAQARYVLLDSQFLAHLLRVTRGSRLPVCAGSDLTANVFAHVVEPNDRIVIIGGQGEQIRQLVERHGMRNVVHLNPPMGFIRDPQAVEECLRFIEAHSPFRFCVLAVGSPQQEIIAQRLQARGVARGLTLCVGASIDFMTGAERRAPVWMRRCGLEWLMRLMQNPARMANRYLVRGPRVFRLLRRTTFVVRSSDV